jgi:hypothetical protein
MASVADDPLSTADLNLKSRPVSPSSSISTEYSASDSYKSEANEQQMLMTMEDVALDGGDDWDGGYDGRDNGSDESGEATSDSDGSDV